MQRITTSTDVTVLSVLQGVIHKKSTSRASEIIASYEIQYEIF